MRAKRKYAFQPDYAVPPGETLLEVMESLGMTQKNLADRTDMTVQSLNRIIKGLQPITYETANKLELVTGVPANFWNNLEAQYREQTAKLEERSRMERDVAWLASIPVKELIGRKIIRAVGNKVDILRDVLSFYGVSNVAAWRNVWEQPAVAAKRSPCFDSHPGPASAWIRQGELQALQMDCGPFDKEGFRGALAEIRGLTRETPEIFVDRLRSLCAQCGVAVALVPEMKKVPWNGATKWITPDKVMILLSLRGKGEDIFWFSFFHEAGHVLHDNKKDLLINDGSQDDPREARANAFAAETLIPGTYNERIRKVRSKAKIMQLADELGIAPGIVAGRYQYLTKNWKWFKNLIRRFQWI